MKNIIRATVFLLGIYGCWGQVLTKQVIGSAGTSLQADSQLSFTIAEPLVGTITMLSTNVAQGFWNASAVIPLSTDDFTNTPAEIQIFPNPVADRLTVQFDEVQSSTYQIEVTDMIGRRQARAVMGTGEAATTFDLTQLRAGTYLVTVLSENANRITYKIIKK